MVVNVRYSIKIKEEQGSMDYPSLVWAVIRLSGPISLPI
jgi:hypothetical protein